MEDIDIASYADDNTPLSTGDNIDKVLRKLEKASKTYFQWFRNNQMKANPNKSHFNAIRNSKIDVKNIEVKIYNTTNAKNY